MSLPTTPVHPTWPGKPPPYPWAEVVELDRPWIRRMVWLGGLL